MSDEASNCHPALGTAIHVVAALIEDANGRVLLTRRADGGDFAGRWEFPGGKVDPGETPEVALARELDEELGIRVGHSSPLIRVPFAYPDKRIVPYAEVEDRGAHHFKKGTDIEVVQKIEKMSKRKGNVVNPDEVIREYGADAMRVYICFLGPMDQDKPWASTGIKAQWDFLRRFWRLFFEGDADTPRVTDAEPSEAELRVVHKAIAKVSDDIEKLALNTAISALAGVVLPMPISPVSRMVAPPSMSSRSSPFSLEQAEPATRSVRMVARERLRMGRV